MPVLKSAKKALRVSKRRKGENERTRKTLQQTTKAFRESPNPASLAKIYSVIDRAVKKNVIHKNKASRLKGSLAKLVKATSNVKGVKKPTKSKSSRTKK